ncbi:hypothetical protein JOQ06_000681, partial [Pogonophryne albipinna]
VFIPEARRWRSSAPFIRTECWCQHCCPPSSFPALLHLCLYLSPLLKMLSPYPRGSTWRGGE